MLNYQSTTVVFEPGQPITPQYPTLAGGAAGASYSVAPPLPLGLSLDSATGIINGTPTASTSGPVTCRVTATTPGGQSASVDLVITVTAQPLPPAGLAYSQPAPVYLAGTAIPGNTPTLAAGSAGVAYAVAPALPDGLNLDPATGFISGIPTTAGTVTCRVTATSPGGQSASVDLVITVTAQPLPPAGLAYSQPAPVYLAGTAIPGNTPTLAAGSAGVAYTVAPALPDGLNLDPATGFISGIPTTAGTVTCRVTATSRAGQSTFVDLVITVTAHTEPPAGLAFSHPAPAYQAGTAIPANSPSLAAGAAGVTYAVAPALPAGLNLDPATGSITGTPSAATPGPVTCRVTATNPAGQSTFVDLVITVTAHTQPPAGLTYTQPAPAYQAGTAIPANAAALAAGAAGVTYAVAPALPAGLNLDPATGSITGTPTAATPGPVTCRVTATNPAGQSTFADLVITVAPPPPAGLAYSQPAPTYQAGAAIAVPNTPTLAAGAAGVTYAVAPALPAGFHFDPATGSITGTPAAATPGPVTCRVTATNPAGQSTFADLVITVDPTPPAGLTYAQAGPAYLVGLPIIPNNPTLAAGAGPWVTYAATDLPPGLNVDPVTGIITGIPTGPTPPPAVPRITATNTAGHATHVDLPITVDRLSYPTLTPEYTVNLAITPVAPANPGPAGTTYAAVALPAGLHLNPVTGVISGTPIAVTFGDSYVITANLAGHASPTAIWLTIEPALRFTEPSATYTVGVPIQPNVPVHGRGLTAAYAVAPPLPPGLAMDPNTGAITGIPTAAAPAAIHMVTVTQPSGAFAHALLDLAVHASRLDAFGVPGAVSAGRFGGDRFDFPGLRRTLQYGEDYPKAPMLHPYFPGQNIRGGKLILTSSLNIKFPATFFEALPAPILAQIAAMGLDRSQVDILCVSQDLMWNHPGPNVLFRPQSWTDPDAPFKGSYSTGYLVTVGLFEAPAGIHIVGPHGAIDHFDENISAHPDGGDLPPVAQSIISSGDSMPFQGLDPLVSTSFWTLTRNGNRAAATLHLILNDADEATLQVVLGGMAAAPHLANLRTLVDQLDRPLLGLRGTRMVDQLKELTRPIVTHAAVGAPNLAGDRVLTLTGTAFTGATGVSIGPQAGRLLHVVSDTQIQVTITDPVPPAPDIEVTTPMGAGRIAYP
jgi:hypothetical protein